MVSATKIPLVELLMHIYIFMITLKNKKTFQLFANLVLEPSKLKVSNYPSLLHLYNIENENRLSNYNFVRFTFLLFTCWELVHCWFFFFKILHNNYIQVNQKFTHSFFFFFFFFFF